jgi:4-hydroxy-tetrahydrodipicolinate synthase
MDATSMETQFLPYGMIIPIATPFHDDESLDLETLQRLTRRLIAAGVHGLFPSGSTGEFFALSMEESYQVIETVIETAAGQIPVYAGAGAITTREAVRRTREVTAMGADAIVIITPYYLSPSQDELYAHYAAIAASTHLPVIPYNNPGRTGGVNIQPDTLVRLAQIDNLVAIKDSSGRMEQFAAYVNETPDPFCVFQGVDSIFFPSLVQGAKGGIAGTGNIVPELVVALYDAYVAGDLAGARSAQTKVALMRQAMTLGTFPAGMKTAMAMIGESVGPARGPVTPLNTAQVEILSRLLTRVGFVVKV